MVVAPCSGLRVLDLAHGYGAIVGMILADFGAEVIKVEPPGGESFRGKSAFWQWNRGKRGVEADLGTAACRDALRSLAFEADILVENFRPGVLDRFGLGYEDLAGSNPELIVLSIRGFPANSRYGNSKGYEGIVAAATGQMLIQNGYRDDGPIYDAVPKCSFGASMLGLIGTLAALQARERTGRGQQVSTSLVQANFCYSYGGIKGETAELTQKLSMIQGRDPHNTMPGYRIAECADSQWVQSGSAGGRIFDNLMRALEIDVYFTDARFKNGPANLSAPDRDELIAAIDQAYATRTLRDWVRRFDENDVAYAEFLTTQEFMDHPQVLHNGHVIDVEDPTHGTMKQIGPLVRFKDDAWVCPGGAPGSTSPIIGSEWAGAKKTVSSGSSTHIAGALEGLTILDLANFAATPGGPGLLADLGARVIKVEPIIGDPMVAGAVSAAELFARINRRKERISINLKEPRGQEVLHRLVRIADVVVHNYRPGVPERLGLDFDTLLQHNEQLVYLYGASFGSSGPDCNRPAFDPVMSAMAGGEVLQAGLGNPPQMRQTTDHSALLGVAAAILIAVRERDRTGKAQNAETTMLCSAAYLMSDDFIRYSGKPDRLIPDSGQYGLNCRYRLYRTFGDGWVFFACLYPNEWERFCRTVGRDSWIEDPIFSIDERAEIDIGAGRLAELFAERSAEEWEALLLSADIACVSATRSWVEYLFSSDPGMPEEFTTAYDTEDYGRVEQSGIGVNLSATPGTVGLLEVLGQSTRSLLVELGYGEAAIRKLEADSVIKASGSDD